MGATVCCIMKSMSIGQEIDRIMHRLVGVETDGDDVALIFQPPLTISPQLYDYCRILNGMLYIYASPLKAPDGSKEEKRREIEGWLKNPNNTGNIV